MTTTIRVDHREGDRFEINIGAHQLAVASHCTIHNTLEQPPAVNIDLAA